MVHTPNSGYHDQTLSASPSLIIRRGYYAYYEDVRALTKYFIPRCAPEARITLTTSVWSFLKERSRAVQPSCEEKIIVECKQ